MRSILKRLLRPFVRPALERYAQLRAHVSQVDRHTTDVARQVELVSHRVGAIETQQLESARRIRVDSKALGEFSVRARRTVDELETRLDDLTAVADGSVYDRLLAMDTHFADRAVRRLIGLPLEELGPGAAAYLNWVHGLDGPVRQSGLEFTAPVWCRFRPGGYDPAWVTERSLEHAYVFGALSDLPLNSHVLDVGACFSTVALTFAELGHRVTALDLLPYPLRHPNLEVVTSPAENWPGPRSPCDAIISISSIEHAGLGAYDEPRGPDDLDIELLRRFREWIRSDGRLVLTVPWGEWHVDDFQRVYDETHLDRLLDGWKVLHRRTFAQFDPLTWVPHDGPPPAWSDTTHGVALITASPT